MRGKYGIDYSLDELPRYLDAMDADTKPHRGGRLTGFLVATNSMSSVETTGLVMTALKSLRYHPAIGRAMQRAYPGTRHIRKLGDRQRMFCKTLRLKNISGLSTITSVPDYLSGLSPITPAARGGMRPNRSCNLV
jgi:hypothetical protein